MNTVNISTTEYLELVEFKKRITEGEIGKYRSPFFGINRGQWYYYKKDEIMTSLADDLKKSKETNKDLIYSTQSAIKDWSIFQFLHERRFFRNEFKQRLIKCAENSGN